ncbi:MAG: hypothetical protein RSD18_04255, partial [Anaerovoracaceae bacterium]
MSNKFTDDNNNKSQSDDINEFFAKFDNAGNGTSEKGKPTGDTSPTATPASPSDSTKTPKMPEATVEAETPIAS